MPTKLPGFAAYRTHAMADGRITLSEAKMLTKIASHQLDVSKNPGPTLDMFDAQLQKLVGKATNEEARSQLTYWKQFPGNTMVQERAAKTLNDYLRTHQGQLPSPIGAIATDPNQNYKAVANENWVGGEFGGGIVTTDNSSDSEYLRVPMDITKLGMTGNESQDDLDRFMGQAQEAMDKFINDTPELKYSGAGTDIVLVVPKPASQPA